MPKTKTAKTVTLPIDLLEEFEDLCHKLSLSINLSEELSRGFRLRLDEIKSKFSFTE
jgi:hypothetical protein